MEQRAFGKLGEVSCLTLGGGGIGQVWGPTSREEAIATVREAVNAGISFLDVAPAYGNGEAELVVGEAFNGRLPSGVRLSTKCMLGNPPRDEVLPRRIGSKINRHIFRYLPNHLCEACPRADKLRLNDQAQRRNCEIAARLQLSYRFQVFLIVQVVEYRGKDSP